MVTFIHRGAGEEMLPGEPVVTVTSQQAQRAIGHLPQGFGPAPPLAATVKVKTRIRKPVPLRSGCWPCPRTTGICPIRW